MSSTWQNGLEMNTNEDIAIRAFFHSKAIRAEKALIERGYSRAAVEQSRRFIESDKRVIIALANELIRRCENVQSV